MSPERIAWMRAELREMVNLALSIHERAVLMEHELANATRACSHPGAVEMTLMGAPARRFQCQDCGDTWTKPWDTPEQIAGEA